ncbi:lipopolysaccharide core heptose(I) kinase RfaP [Rosenbergiella australiborealis]|uniref:Lipopolysaccharide core heptose(I) kinase n=1 Tax=Rosenbergiella australiborealis TaxID=1544696 RepID=A0ABS5T4Z2_9GAMM|nr:lipopolysaccharide core heptose(I) kinase RfaP [Rosenbergiella australiborealis]MBT0727414.1 lipopolysaccharide core heptose(I) kinase RfaP [Rosenbergiella australiborealis]
MLQLEQPFKQAWAHSDPYAEILALQGETYRQVEARKTMRFDFKGESYFVKYHRGTALKEVFKNLITLRLPVLGAKNEWQAIAHLHNVNVPTMSCYGYGQRHWNPLQRESFIITKDLNPAVSLEDYCANWAIEPPRYCVKRELIRQLARTVGAMHRSGLNHRDCYICHFLLALPFDECKGTATLSVIDLHRAQIRKKTPLRWRDKDLIALYYSSFPLALSLRDYCYFLAEYFEKTVHEIFQKERGLIRQAQKKAEKIKQRTLRKNL